MNKLWLIVRREYLIRVKKKSFILATLLTPLGMAALMIGAGMLGANSSKANQKVLVKDDSGIVKNANLKKTSMVMDFTDQPLDSLTKNYVAEGYDMALYIPPFDDLSKDKHAVKYYAAEKPGISAIEGMERRIEKAFKDHKISNSEIDREVYNSLSTTIDVEDGAQKDDESDSKVSIMLGTAFGMIMGFLMYMVILVYGMMVMRSVMEEKINRISEVMISSVKPFYLMLGKVLGVGLVGLTQVAIWIVLIPIAMTVTQTIIGVDPQADQLEQLTAAAQEVDGFDIGEIFREVRAMNWVMIIPAFLAFFFGGYFMYSALFAAIGSAIGDDMQEGQSLMLPVMLPIIVGFMMLQGVITNPNGSMAVIGSMIPLISPIIMPARLAFDPPIWQVLLSIAILVLTCVFFAWLAGRIYRVGILMYGKKVNFKELSKWIFYKG